MQHTLVKTPSIEPNVIVPDSIHVEVAEMVSFYTGWSENGVTFYGADFLAELQRRHPNLLHREKRHKGSLIAHIFTLA